MSDAADAGSLTAGQVSRRLSVTVRALHHWDEAGLDRMIGAHERSLLLTAGQQLAERHREVFSPFFPLTRQMQVCLGRRYEADPAFAAHYDGSRGGLAS